MKIRSIYLLFALAFASAFTLPAAAASPSYLCKAGEHVVFACQVGKKMVSVCASPGVTRDSGYVQYRFGTPTHVELTFPPKLQPPGDTFHISSTGYSGGGAQMLRFANGEYEYILFERTVRTNFTPGETNDPVFSDGVLVRHKGKRTATLPCDGVSTGIHGPEGEVFLSEEFNDDILP
jgi:hypothetical protein